MNAAASGDECCRVPACGQTAVGYVQIGSRGLREVYVGRPAALNHFPLCADHLAAAGAAPSRQAHQHLRVS